MALGLAHRGVCHPRMGNPSSRAAGEQALRRTMAGTPASPGPDPASRAPLDLCHASVLKPLCPQLSTSTVRGEEGMGLFGS